MRFRFVGPFREGLRPGDVYTLNGQSFLHTHTGARSITIPPPDDSDRGPAGEQGVTGKDGIDGVVGPPGEPGIVWRGAWRKETSYVVNNVVTHDHAAWICVAPDGSMRPGVTAKSWKLFVKAERGERGEKGGSSQGRRGPAGADAATVEAGFAESMARGDVVCIAGDNIVSRAIANTEATATAVGLVSGPNRYQTHGPLTCETWTLTPGTVYYLDPSTPGAMTTTYPTGSGQYVVILGAAATPTQLNINIHWLLVQP